MNSKLEERFCQVATAAFKNNRSMEAWELLIGEVIRAAAMYWSYTSDVEDFCVQSISASSVIFGSTNRLIWTPFTGFKPDPRYCTPGFLDHYASIGAYPKL